MRGQLWLSAVTELRVGAFCRWREGMPGLRGRLLMPKTFATDVWFLHRRSGRYERLQWPGIGPFTPLHPGRMRLEAPDRKVLYARCRVNHRRLFIHASSRASFRVDVRAWDMLVAGPKAPDVRVRVRAVGTSLLSEQARAGFRHTILAPDAQRLHAATTRLERAAAMTRHCVREGRPASCPPTRHGRIAIAHACATVWMRAKGARPTVEDAILAQFDSNLHTQRDRDVKCHRPT